ncbi:ATP-dependent RNA helicase HrpA [Aliikangiella marina]|nr:ATP-dependent RNA helicase HrpA [Aliikangiella marina]
MLDKIDFKQLQTKDSETIKRLCRSISSREKQRKPVDKLREKLEHLVEKSQNLTRGLNESLPVLELNQDLPIAKDADRVIELLHKHQVVIVAGETGCGKTTQLPKLCVNAGFGRRGLIGHTQPRRVAATSVAQRIAEEVKTPLGEFVGYSVRFNNKLSEKTRIKLMTDGILLAEIEADPMLSRYEVLIIDEAHERSLNIDFLLGFLKKILAKRPDLKLIITSATIDPESFAKHFNQAPVVLVEGRSFPVEVRYRPIEESEDNDDDRLLSTVVDAVDECSAESRGDILIFADGEAQIKAICKRLAKSNLDSTVILPLYARLGIKEQQNIFKPSQKRKIIVSTNVAETSLTVPGIIFVIDIGNARISRFSQRNKIQQLPVEKVSQASAEQRKGRCGRVAPGVCIRLYSEEDFNLREAYTLPEIRRTNLSSVVLKLKALNVHDIDAFPFMDKPDERAWRVAYNSLFELAALNNQQEITPIGKAMASLPIDPQLARILVEPKLTAVNEMLIFCALMSVREVRERPHDKQQKADGKHQQYIQGDSDIVTALNLWKILDAKKTELSSNNFKKWCRDNFINFLGWLEWRRVYFQLKESAEQINIKVNQSEVHFDEVHRALIPGFITHVFQKTQEVYYQGVRGLKVWIHPSSLSFKKSKPWLLSAEMIETEKLYARMNGEVKPEWIEEAVPHLLKSQYNDIHWRKNKGQVCAILNQTVLGLPIVNARVINYSQIDPDKSREIFLLDGLAQDQLQEKFPFLISNRKKLAELEEQEQRKRLNNIRIDKHMLASLYDKFLPKHIVSTISLKRWLKKDFKKRNQQLSFNYEQLTQVQSNDLEDFPSTLQVKGVELNLSYTFAPGTQEDGVSVEIPRQMLDQFNDRDFDWLVPGYLHDKILATIKSLPKTLRRSLIPLADTATACHQELKLVDQQGKRFVDELARVLQRYSGIQIKPEQFQMEGVEPHLSMKYKVLGTHSKSGARVYSETIGELKKRLVDTQPNKPKSKVQSRVTGLPNNDFQIEFMQRKDGQNSRFFAGYVDQAGEVKVSRFASREVAEYEHFRGVARLLLVNNHSEVNRFIKGWPDRKTLEFQNLRAGGFYALADTLCLMVAKDIIGTLHPVTRVDDFIAVDHQFKKGYRAKLADSLTQVKPLIKQREKLFSELSELNESAFATSIKDIRQQLESLWSIETLFYAGKRLFIDYTRYHSGVQSRIKRIKTNYPKEEQALDVWHDWNEWFEEIAEHENVGQIASKFHEVYWAMQEFRISLFSPGVKVSGSISTKRLQTLMDQLEQELELI